MKYELLCTIIFNCACVKDNIIVSHNLAVDYMGNTHKKGQSNFVKIRRYIGDVEQNFSCFLKVVGDNGFFTNCQFSLTNIQ